MHDEIERFVLKGQRLRHVGAHDLDGIALARGHDALTFELAGRIVQHGAARAHRREQGHLLPAAAGQTQHALALHIAQPRVGHGFRGREENRRAAFEGGQIRFVRYGLSPFPALLDPLVDGSRVYVLIVHESPPLCISKVVGCVGFGSEGTVFEGICGAGKVGLRKPGAARILKWSTVLAAIWLSQRPNAHKKSERGQKIPARLLRFS